MPISCDLPQLVGMFFMFYAAQHKKIFGKIVQNTELCRRYPFGSFLLERTTSNFIVRNQNDALVSASFLLYILRNKTSSLRHTIPLLTRLIRSTSLIVNYLRQEKQEFPSN